MSENDFIEIPSRIPRVRILTIGVNKGNSRCDIPAIRFSYSWLKSLGYVTGKKIKLIILDDNSLLIQKCEEVGEIVDAKEEMVEVVNEKEIGSDSDETCHPLE